MIRKVGVLTSSRADFGIYLPLLKALQEEISYELKIIAFGTHLSHNHGYTVAEMKSEGFVPSYVIESMPLSDSKEDIALSMGQTIVKFSGFWNSHGNSFDLVFCLGDRFEMFAAVMAGVPFQIKFAHIHGGEKTLGAIDNVFRHSISHASQIHFASTEAYKARLLALVDNRTNIYYTGALSLDNLDQIPLLSVDEFKQKWDVDLSIRTILTTFHPETIDADLNVQFAEEIVNAIISTENYQFLITMPNADTAGNTIRDIFKKKLSNKKQVYLVENLGTKSYFTAMKYCSCMLGNTSSGIIEAASFGKYVINIGNRQEGRACSDNVIQIPINTRAVKEAIDKISGREYTGINIYHKANVAQTIMKILKKEIFHD